MTFPVREATATTFNAGSAGANLPAGIAAGNVLLLTVYNYSGDAILTPSGWIELTAAGNVYWFKKTADGSEGATVALTSSGSGGWLAVAERWSGASGNVEAATSVASADPPSLAASWGTKDTAWITSGGFASGVGSGTDDSTEPTNYANKYSRGIGFVFVASCYRTNAAASEDPSAWTAPGGTVRVTTIAVEPAAAPGQPASRRMGGVQHAAGNAGRLFQSAARRW